MRKPAPNRPSERTSAEVDQQIREKGKNPFVRPEHVIDGEELSLTGFNYLGKDGQFCVTVQKMTDGTKFTLGIREGSPDHEKFFEAFGTNDFHAWAPGSVTVTIGKGSRPGTDVSFVNVKAVNSR
jgi:hypothetical protein